MSRKTPVRYIDIRVFVHATEEADRVLDAVRNTFSTESIEAGVFQKTRLAGHHGNPIVLFQTRIKEKTAILAFIEKLSQGLSSTDKEQLKSEIGLHVDGANLYLRLDKQSAYQKKLKLCSADPIHFRIHFETSSLEDMVDLCKRFGVLP